MKTILVWLALVAVGVAQQPAPSNPPPAAAVVSEPIRVALLDFDNKASLSSDAAVVGGIRPQTLADKGVYALGKVMVNQPGFVLIDRRDFLNQLQAVQLRGGSASNIIQPSFLRAAQAVNADVVLRGSLLSYSPGKQVINQGGYKAEFLALVLRVGLDALDTRDGAVIASVDGSARKEFRQTDAQQTVVGEDDLLALMQSAVEKAAPELTKALQARMDQDRRRPVVKLSVKSSADPALVELDGILIGATPLTDFKTYAGDHVLTVGKSGYRDVNKRILINTDLRVEVPLIRTELTADEIKEVLEKSRLNIIAGTPEPALIINTVE